MLEGRNGKMSDFGGFPTCQISSHSLAPGCPHLPMTLGTCDPMCVFTVVVCEHSPLRFQLSPSFPCVSPPSLSYLLGSTALPGCGGSATQAAKAQRAACQGSHIFSSLLRCCFSCVPRLLCDHEVRQGLRDCMARQC